jgi:hypothetical protein
MGTSIMILTSKHEIPMDRRRSYSLLAGAEILLLLIFAVPAGGQTTVPGVHVELDAAHLSLRVTLQSGAEVPVTFYRSLLPWGNRYSMVLEAVTPTREPLKQNLYIDDPGPGRVTLEPKAALSGDVDLQKMFVGLDKALKKSDVIVFWAYKAPNGLGIPTWSGGWVLIPQQGKGSR